MNIGVKIYPNNRTYITKIRKHVDFFEVMAIKGENYSFVSKMKKPIVLHAEDFKYQSNLGNPENNSMNNEYLQFVLDLMKESDARYIILNPGIRFNNRCTTDNHIHLFNKYGHTRFLLENQPPMKSRTYPFYGRNYDELRQFVKNTRVGICLDLDHAFASSFFFNRDPIEFTRDILELKPKHFHISNGRNNSYLDAHLHFDEGDFNMLQMKELIPKDAWVTLDTQNDFEKQVEEIRFLREKEFRK